MQDRVIVFDVNETLLDLGRLDQWFTALFGSAAARMEWFALMLRWSMVATLTDTFRDFSQLAYASLDAVAETRGVTVADADRQQLFEQIRHLPPHDDVLPALHELRAAGFRLIALTNSAQATVDAQLAHAAIAPLMERILSVDAVRRFKPHPAVYRHAADTLGLEIGALRLVAAHDWDITGALAAGCAGAFVARGSAAVHPAGHKPDITGSDLAKVATAIIATDRPCN